MENAKCKPEPIAVCERACAGIINIMKSEREMAWIEFRKCPALTAKIEAVREAGHDPDQIARIRAGHAQWFEG